MVCLTSAAEQLLHSVSVFSTCVTEFVALHVLHYSTHAALRQCLLFA